MTKLFYVTTYFQKYGISSFSKFNFKNHFKIQNYLYELGNKIINLNKHYIQFSYLHSHSNLTVSFAKNIQLLSKFILLLKINFVNRSTSFFHSYYFYITANNNYLKTYSITKLTLSYSIWLKFNFFIFYLLTIS